MTNDPYHRASSIEHRTPNESNNTNSPLRGIEQKLSEAITYILLFLLVVVAPDWKLLVTNILIRNDIRMLIA